MRKKPLQESRPCINFERDKSHLLMEKKTLNVAAISFTVALGSLGLFFQPFLIVRVLCLFLNKKRPGFSQLIFYSALFAPLPYYEMVLRQADGQTIVEKRWGRLRYGILPVNTKKIENVFHDRQIGLDQFMKTLSQKEKRGYRLSDERGLI